MTALQPAVTDVLAGPIDAVPGVRARPRHRAARMVAAALVIVVLGIAVYQQGRTAGRQAAEHAAQNTAETAYLTILRSTPVAGSFLPRGLSDLTDVQLVAFGWQACAAFRDGSSVADMTQAYGQLQAPIPGQPGMIASPPNPMLPLVADTATRELCPQYLASSDPGPPRQRWDPSQ